MSKIAILGILTLSFCACSTENLQQAAAPSGYPINGQSAIRLATYFKFMPSLSGYYLPAGIYVAERENADGVYFKAPKGAMSLSLTGGVEVGGGIFLPKLGGRGVRGYAYLNLPLLGSTPYYIPDEFFSTYGKNWGIMRVQNQSTDPTLPFVMPTAVQPARQT